MRLQALCEERDDAVLRHFRRGDRIQAERAVGEVDDVVVQQGLRLYIRRVQEPLQCIESLFFFFTISNNVIYL